MPTMTDTWRLVGEMSTGTELFRNEFDVKHIGVTPLAPPGSADPIVDAFVNWLIANFYPDVTVQTMTCREIQYKLGPPPHPATPPIFTRFVNTAGTANTLYGGAHNANALPKDVAIFMKKSCVGGRAGKMFLRNILTEVDVQASLGGSWTFSPGAGHYDPVVQETTVVTILQPFFTITPTSGEHCFSVTHLENIPVTDTRTPFSTLCTQMDPVRPVWNKASR